MNVVLTSATIVASVLLAYVLVRHSAKDAAGLLLAVPVALVLSRRDAGLLAGIVLLLVLPDGLTFFHISVLRLASLAAAVTILFTRQRLRPCATDLAVVLLLVVGVLGWLLQDNEPGIGNLLLVEFGPVGFYIGARAFDHRRLHLLSAVMLAAGTVGALTVIAEFVAGHRLFGTASSYLWNQTSSTIFRPGGIFGGPPQAGEALCFVLLFGLAAASQLQGRRRRLAAACVAITTIALTLTFTRAAIIAAAVGVLGYLWLVRSPLLRARTVVPVLLTAGAVVLLALPTLQQSKTIQEGVFRAGTLTQREGYWADALPIATSSPHNFVFGAGTGLLEAPVVSGRAPLPVALAIRPQAYSTSIHSQYVTTLDEEGVIGLGAVILLLVVPLLRSGRVARAEGHREYAAVCASLISVAIIMTVDTALLDGVTFAMMMTAAGIAATAGKRRIAYGQDRARTN